MKGCRMWEAHEELCKEETINRVKRMSKSSNNSQHQTNFPKIEWFSPWFSSNLITPPEQKCTEEKNISKQHRNDDKLEKKLK